MGFINHTHETKVLDGKATLGRSKIKATPKINGKNPPDGLVFDLVGGMVEWEDQDNLGDPGPYEFSFDYDDTPVKSDAEIEQQKFKGQAWGDISEISQLKIIALKLGLIDELGNVR